MNTPAYLDVRQRVDQLVRGIDAEVAVPTCPGWSVRDVVAHLTGLCEDWCDGRLDNYASDIWTSAQITRLRALTIDEILERWGSAASRFADLDDDPVMGPPARWAFGDAVTHEADIRGALGAARVPRDAVMLALKGAVARWRQVLRDARAPTVLLRAPDSRVWWLGEADDPEAISVDTSTYEIFRALSGRRSERQVRDWHWSVSPDPILRAGLPYPFHWSDDDILNE